MSEFPQPRLAAVAGSCSLTNPAFAFLRDPLVAAVALCAAGVFITTAILVAHAGPFPSQFDELQHLSYIRWMARAPFLFPDYGHMPTLAPDLTGWTAAPNYLAHPPLYYGLMSLLPGNVAILRGANVALAFAGSVMPLIAGLRVLGSRLSRVFFAALVMLFPRAVVIAGMINNDNLVLFETGLLLLVIVAVRHRAVVVALLLALIGWTKFNAFVGLATFVGLIQLQEIARGETRLFGRDSLLLAAGLLIGFVPVIANLIYLGVPIYTPVNFLEVPVASRMHFNFLGFSFLFLHHLGREFPPAEGSLDCTWPLLIAFLFATLGAFGRDIAPREKMLARAAMGALVVFYITFLCYGWRSFVDLGLTSDAQPRYFDMLWPGFVFALAIGLSRAIGIASRIWRGLSMTQSGYSGTQNSQVD